MFGLFEIKCSGSFFVSLLFFCFGVCVRVCVELSWVVPLLTKCGVGVGVGGAVKGGVGSNGGVGLKGGEGWAPKGGPKPKRSGGSKVFLLTRTRLSRERRITHHCEMDTKLTCALFTLTRTATRAPPRARIPVPHVGLLSKRDMTKD